MSWSDYPNFSSAEFACKHCGAERMDMEFVGILQTIRHTLGAPMIPSSGYRCPEHNVAVSSTGPNGPHTTGRSADIVVAWHRYYALVQIAMAHKLRVGLNLKGDSRFVHLDNLDKPGTIWTY